MVFKKMLNALGLSGASVDAVLTSPVCRPGGFLEGEVRIAASDKPMAVERVTLGLATRVESEHGDHEYRSGVEFHRVDIAGRFALTNRETQVIPFRFAVPWEAPITSVYGQPLRGMTMGLHTELAIDRAIDKSDLDPVQIEPLPAQERILEAFQQLGFSFKGADLEQGRLGGIPQTLPFFQEIEFYPPSFAAGINEVELSFVAGPSAMHVVLEVDKRGGLFSGGGDTYRHFHVDYDHLDRTKWTAEIDAWIRHAAASSGHHGGGHGYRHGGGHHGMGMGSVVGGAAAGFLGGMVAGQVMDDFSE